MENLILKCFVQNKEIGKLNLFLNPNPFWEIFVVKYFELINIVSVLNSYFNITIYRLFLFCIWKYSMV